MNKRKRKNRRIEKNNSSEKNNSKEKVICLATPRKKGFFKIVFSRLFIILLLIILQVLILMSIYDWFSDYMPHFTWLQMLFTLLMITHLFSSDMDSSRS